MNRETLALLQAQREQVGALLTTATDTSLAAWAKSWNSIQAEIIDLVESGRWDTIGQVERRRLLLAAQDQAGRRVQEAAEESNRAVTSTARGLISRSLDEQDILISSQLPGGATGAMVALSRPAGAALDAMVQRTTQQITALHYHLAAEATESMKRALSLGIAAGDNPRTVAALMVKNLEDAFNGGVARAQVIARTEMIDAHRRAAEMAQDANADVLAGWLWVASLTERTCPSCIAQHGRLHPLDEPGPLDHQQGRCARVPVTKTWEELGFIGIPETRVSMETGTDWFNRQTADVQRNILGPGRFDAWERGDYPMADWSQRRTTDGWRDSYGVGPLGPDSRQPGLPDAPTTPRDPLAGLDMDGMSDQELMDLTGKLMEANEWPAVTRMEEYLDARDAAERPWTPDLAAVKQDLSAAFTDDTFAWFETATEPQRARLLAAVGEQWTDDFYMAQYGHVQGATARTTLVPVRQIRADWELWKEVDWVHAEAATNGNMLTAQARAEGHVVADLYRFSDQHAYSWASDEMKQYWEDTGGRQTWQRFRAAAEGDVEGMASRSKGIAW